jgi:hypothetical protein
MVAAGGVLTAGLLHLARRSAAALPSSPPLLPALTFAAALVCFWVDAVDSRFLQAAVPDACFAHAVVHALRMGVTGHWNARQGVSLRTPAPLPPIASERAHPPNVVLVLTESVRADDLCSEPPPSCRSPFLDEVAADRIPLGMMTSQTPNTFSACMVLWTGLAPNADFTAVHTAPVLWELARAVGYRTAYVTAQNPRYEDFGTYVRRAGIDVMVTAIELGGMEQEQLGAPDERATEAALRFAREAPADVPFFAVVHLSNTHAPYRDDPSLRPFAPWSLDPLGNAAQFRNHYRNAVRLQERTIAAFVRALRDSPRWDDTVLVFLSDHGEQFRDHRGLYHNHSLYEEELRVPGWILAGPRALGEPERAALRSYAGRRTFMQDAHATMVDLLGLAGAQPGLPLAASVGGRSLLRPFAGEATALLATSTAVWEPDDARFGAMRAGRALVGAPGAWECFDTVSDPTEHRPLPAAACGDLLDLTQRSFAGAR